MKKVATITLWANTEVEDYKECAEEIIDVAKGHEFSCDGTIKVEVKMDVEECNHDMKSAGLSNCGNYTIYICPKCGYKVLTPVK